MFRAAEVLPGGAETLATLHELTHLKNPGPVVTRPFEVPGNYEIRLMSHGGLFHRRVALEVRDPLHPPWPEEIDYRTAERSDWPYADDPFRGSASWRVPEDDCIPPSFTTPPQVLAVAWQSKDPNDPDDDAYVPLERVWPGKPFALEARFSEPPERETYRVKLSGGGEVTVARTADPKVYRSELITLVRDQP